MSKYLLIVESPTKVKTIGKFLGKDYKVEASVGHIRDLPKSTMGIDIEKGFAPKYVTIRGKGEILNRLKKEAQKAKSVYLATDPDREGEAISWHLATLLGLDKDAVCRITFNELTKNVVKNALKSPRIINIDLVNAQQTRRILDRIVGYNISPLLWRKVRKGLSAGRVQSVATRLVCDREDEILAFVPREYWTITAELSKIGKKTTFTSKFYGFGSKKMDLPEQSITNEVVEKINAGKFIVTKIKTGTKSKTPPPPFITSTLQQEASRKFGFTAKKTMLLAQQLYEGIDIKGSGSTGLVTYIRTDSVRISSDATNEIRAYITKKFGSEYLPEKPRIYKNRNASQDAHEAIRPVYLGMEPVAIKDSLTNDQFKLYKLIWDRFTASQMKPAIYDTMNVDIDASGYTFKTNGARVKFQGYMVIYTESQDEPQEDEVVNLPELSEGEELILKKLLPEQRFTQPPPRYTEATLVKALEENGIGRPSTFATIIYTIQERGYIEREKRILKPTDTAKIVNDLMKTNFPDIVDVEFTAKIEKFLDDIEAGNVDYEEVLGKFYGEFSKTLEMADKNIEKIIIPDVVTNIQCEKCGKFMVVKHGRYGKFLACPGFPECRNAKPLLEEAGVICPKCGGKVMIRKSKKGRTFYSCEKSPECDFVVFDKPLKGECPKCNSFLIRKYAGKTSKTICANPDCDYTKVNESNEK